MSPLVVKKTYHLHSENAKQIGVKSGYTNNGKVLGVKLLIGNLGLKIS